MSPESAALEAARERVQFVTRPALFCAACGAAVMQEVFGPIRREVWCAERACHQHGKRLNVFDPVVDGVPHA
jgi:hypothetical protein